MINQEVIKAFGDRIKCLRKNKGISQEELSFQTGFHRTYIGMIERGERNISLSNIAVFAKAFKMNISELLDIEKQTPSIGFSNYKLKSDITKSSRNE